jgi:hypothetical protein
MSAIITYDSTVAARTRAAAQILATPDLLSLYESKGGLKADLEKIRDRGQEAEALSQARSGAQAAGGTATLNVLATFTALQKEYSAIMGVVQAARYDLEEAKATTEALNAVDRILVNEAEVAIKTVVGDDGASKKVAVKRLSQEATRAEIARDARALLELSAVHAVLKKRKVDKSRLTKLATAAESLSGKLAERASAKGEQKQATAALRDAVSAQKQVWGACYRLLAAVGQDDTRVAQLLADAARKRQVRKPKKS